MVYSTFMAAVFGMLFAYLTIEDSWFRIIPCILYLAMICIGQHFEDRMIERIKKLEKEIEEIKKENYNV